MNRNISKSLLVVYEIEIIREWGRRGGVGGGWG